MQIVKGDAGEPSRRPTDNFRGDVWADTILPPVDGVRVSSVSFAPGARTHWHVHEHGQLLQVVSGRGAVCVDGEGPREIGVGDVVWTAPGERHWHGAGAHRSMLHVAVSLGSVEWFGPVDDRGAFDET